MDNILAPLLKQSKRFHPGLVAPNYRASCAVFAVRKNSGMSEVDKKKAKITDEHIEEARRLRAIYDKKRAANRKGWPSQEKIGVVLGIGTQSMVGHFLGGRSALTLTAAVAFAKFLGCQAEDFSPRLAEEQKALTDAREQARHTGTASDVADALRTSVQAIAEKWGINNPMDLLDPSPEARERVEHAIATAGFITFHSFSPVLICQKPVVVQKSACTRKQSRFSIYLVSLARASLDNPLIVGLQPKP